MSVMLEPPPTATRHRVTPEDLLARPDESNFELVNGELVERTMSFESERIGTNLLIALGAYVRGRNLGEVNGSSAGYQCFGGDFDDPNKVRRPDVSFISAARVPGAFPHRGNCQIVPDLAVEVISPNDLSEEVEAKVDEYLQAGVKLVWVAHPMRKTVRIHRANGTVSVVRMPEELTGEDIIPGFSCPLSEVFRVPSQQGS